MSYASVRPFQFTHLEKLTRSQVDLHAAITRFLPEALASDAWLDAIREEFKKYVNTEVDFELTALREPTFAQYEKSIPDPTIIFVISCEPLAGKAFLQLDYALAHIMVDRMLGGTGDYPDQWGAITPIQEGVLKFLILKVLNLLVQHSAPNEIQFRLERLVSNSSDISGLAADDDLVALMSVQMTLGRKAGFIRLALPHPLVDGFMHNLAPAAKKITYRDLRRLERIVDVKLPVWIEMGRVDIDSHQFSNLEEGDVILMEEVMVELGEQGITGPINLRVHDGVGGGLRGRVVHSTDASIEVEIDAWF